MIEHELNNQLLKEKNKKSFKNFLSIFIYLFNTFKDRNQKTIEEENSIQKQASHFLKIKKKKLIKRK